MEENYIQFTMRMEKGLYEKLKESASKNRRSIAKELEHITDCHLQFSEPPNDEDLLYSEEVNVLAHQIIQLLNKSGKSGIKIQMPKSEK